MSYPKKRKNSPRCRVPKRMSQKAPPIQDFSRDRGVFLSFRNSSSVFLKFNHLCPCLYNDHILCTASY